MEALKKHLVAALRGGLAYDTFDNIVGEFEPAHRGIVPDGAERSAWQILEHMRLCLRDILDYSQNDDGRYREMDWPEEYWPKNAEPQEGAWEKTVGQYVIDMRELELLVMDPERDLFTPFPWAKEHTLLREVLIATDHQAHHLGQLIELKRWIAAKE